MKKKCWALDLLGVLACALCAGVFWIWTNALFTGAMLVAHDDDNAPRTWEAFPLYVRVCSTVADIMLYPLTLVPRQFVPNTPWIMLVPALFWGALIYFAGKALVRAVRRFTSATPSR
jgi:hypothetical protein